MTTQTKAKNGSKRRQPNPADVADDARRKVWAIRDALCTFLTERNDAVELSIAALITNEHTFLMGPPGTGKSLLNDSIAMCVDGRYCDRLMHKAMTPDELVGALDLAKFQAEKVYRRNLDGGVMSAEIVFLDEIWKGNSLSLNALLKALNERKYSEQGKVHRIPLRSCFSASNEFPAEDGLAALYDRFMFRDVLGYIDDRQARKALWKAKANRKLKRFVPPSKLTLDELDAIVADVDNVTLSDAMADELDKLLDKLSDQGIVVSDRRSVKALTALKAAAWLDGDYEITVDHLQILRFVLWDTPDEREKVLVTLKTLARSAGAKACEQIDEVLRKWRARPSDPLDFITVAGTLLAEVRTVGDEIHEQMEGGAFKGRAKDKVSRRLKELNQIHNDIVDAVAATKRL